MSSPAPDTSTIHRAVARGLARDGRRRPGARWPRLAIELTPHSFRAVVVDGATPERKLSSSFHVAVPRELIDDPPQRSSFLGRALRQAVGKRDTRNMSCMLSSNTVRTAIEQMPPLPMEDLVGALSLKAAKLVGSSPEEWSLSVTRLSGDGTGPTGGRYLLSAIENRELEELAAVFHAAGCLPNALTLPLAAFPRLMEAASEDDQDSDATDMVWVVVDVQRRSTAIHVYHDQVLEYSRTVEFGGDEITAALMDVVATPGGFIELTFEEAEQLKVKVGYPPEEGCPALGPEDRLNAAQMRMMLEPKLKTLVFELRNSIRFYQQKSGRHRIHRLTLTGGASALNGLDEYVHQNLKIPPHRFTTENTPLSLDIQVAEPMRSSLLRHGAGLCALADGPPPALDLLPAEVRADRALRLPSRLVATLAFMLVGSIAFLGFQLDEATASSDVDLPVGQVEGYDEGIEAARAELSEVSSKLESLARCVGSDLPAAGMLRDIARHTPEQAVLSSLNLVSRGQDARVAVRGVILNAGDRQPAVALIDAYGQSPYVKQVAISSLVRSYGSQGVFFRFHLEVTPYVLPPGVQP